MGIKSSACVALTVALSGAVGSALAAEDSGAYIGAGIGYSTYGDDDKLDAYDLDDSSTGWNVYGGYRILRNLAVEAGYTNFGEFSAELPLTSTDESFQAFTLAAVGILPLGETWQLRGKIGGGWLQLDQSFSNQGDADDTGGTFMVGIAAQWAPAALNGLAFSANLDGYFFTVEQLNEDYNQSTTLLSVGVQYAF
jgi:OOP family OmpA-OmpF porin